MVATTATAGVAAFTQPRNPTFCDTVTPWGAQTQVKVAAVYTFPFDIQTSVSFQHFPGVTQSANIVANNALIAPSLSGRSRRVRGDGRGRRVAVAASVRGDARARPTSVSSKPFRLGGTRKVQGIFDIYNAFNARPVLGVTTRYTGATGGAWLRPTSTLVGRLLKFGVQFDF